MKRNIIACILIVACLVATLATMHQTEQAEAKGTNTQAKSSVFKIVTYIKHNRTTGTFYFAPSHPACIPLNYKQAIVTIKNTAGTSVYAYSFGYLKPGQSASLTIAINGRLYDTMFTLEQTSPTATMGFVDIMTCGA